MNKKIAIAIITLSIAPMPRADDASDLEKEQDALNYKLEAALESKPTKEAKSLANDLYKEGWKVPAGEPSLEQQLMRSIYLDSEVMGDEHGTTKRYLQHTAISNAKNFDMAFAASRAIAQNEMAALISTEIMSILDSQHINTQTDAESSNAIESFRQRVHSLVSGSFGNFITTVIMYRKLPNGHYEVSVRLAYDKNYIITRIQESLPNNFDTSVDD